MILSLYNQSNHTFHINHCFLSLNYTLKRLFNLIRQNFHFINNQLVFGSLIIPHHNNQTISALSKLLSIKYSESLSNKLESSIVVDSDNNRIFYSNYFYPTLIYIGNNVQQIKPMLKKSTESKIFRIQKHLSAWYERL